MAYIDEAQASSILNTITVSKDQTIIKHMLNRLLWSFYEQNKNLVVFDFKLWFFRPRVLLSDIRPLFVRIVGEPVGDIR